MATLSTQTKAVLNLIDSMGNGYDLDKFLNELDRSCTRGTLWEMEKAANKLGISRRQLDRWCDRGILERHKIPGTNKIGVNRWRVLALKNKRTVLVNTTNTETKGGTMT